MKVVGQAVLRAPAEQVWAALHDPAMLARALPGCERLEVTGPGVGQCVMSITMTPVSGTYFCQLSLADQQRPDFLAVTVAGSGDQGTISADLTVRITPAEQGASLVSYDASSVVGGQVAGVGTRLLASAAKRIAADFLTAIADVIAAEAIEPAPVVTPAPAAEAGYPAEPTPVTGTPVIRARRTGRADPRVAVLAGCVIGLAGIIIGMLLARKASQPGRGPA